VKRRQAVPAKGKGVEQCEAVASRRLAFKGKIEEGLFE
jgi:hypothetical protein